MSLLAACVEANPQNFYFATTAGAGATELSSPTLILSSDNDNAPALRLTCDGDGNTSIAPNGSTPTATMSLGGSTTNNQTLVINQNSGTGQGFIQVGNPNGGTSVSIVGQTSPNGAGVIQGSGSGSLQLGANATSYDNLTLNNDHTVSLVRAPVLAYGLAATTTLQQVDHGTNTVISIPAGAQSAGLYCVLIQTATSINVSDAPAHMSMTYYWNGTQIVAGGAVSGPTQVGGPAGAYSIAPYAASGVFNQLNFVNSSAGSAVVPTINWIKLAGPITGFP